jgi:tetratricopeptide (TPR) repeat protein
LVKVFKKLGLYQKALETLDLCEDLSKTIRLFHLAEINRKLERFSESELNYTNHLELEPNHALSYRGLALINKKRRHYHDALTQIEIAITKSSPNTQQYNILKVDRADIYRKMTKYNEAEVELLTVINDEDSHRKLTGLEMADALYSLVVLFIDQQKANETTLGYLKKAQILYQNSRCDIKLAMCNFLNGRIHLQMGRFDSCFQYFLEGIDYFERNKITSLELADGYCDFASAVIYSANENYSVKAKKFIADAKQIFRHTYPNGHDKIQLCDNLLILFEPL